MAKYKVRQDWNVEELLKEYQRLLQREINEIWDNKKTKHRYPLGNGKCNYYETTRLIPYFPKSNEFKRELRNKLLRD